MQLNCKLCNNISCVPFRKHAQWLVYHVLITLIPSPPYLNLPFTCGISRLAVIELIDLLEQGKGPICFGEEKVRGTSEKESRVKLAADVKKASPKRSEKQLENENAVIFGRGFKTTIKKNAVGVTPAAIDIDNTFPTNTKPSCGPTIPAVKPLAQSKASHLPCHPHRPKNHPELLAAALA